ncbi:MAG: histidinol-phosphatase [Lachnospiraceae bacterium]|nr:histidinol-phosphatase [Lachnospiraceae bacterium]
MLANYHTHTVRCKHAVGTEREYIEHAISQGFRILGFSDHVPQPYPNDFTSNIRMSMGQLPEYIEVLLQLREEYKDKIQLLIGFEVEYSIKYFNKLMNILQDYPIDYIIQGQHNVPDEIDGFYAGSKTGDEKILKSYVDYTIEGMKTGMFSYLAHPDLINYTGDDLTFQKHMQHLIAASIDLNIPLEINMYGFLDKRNYPCNRFFKLASEMGADFIIGCDAHKPDVVRQPENLEGFTDFLKSNNIKYGDNTVKLIPINI